ncbi:MAG: NAD+ synthase [Candidatus Eiseniibacteriota bacterium]
MNPRLFVDAAPVERILTAFLRAETASAGFSRGVLGLSGGLDSAVVCYLAAKALGPENVTAVLMPVEGVSSADSVTQAELVVRETGVRGRVVDVGSMAGEYLRLVPDAGVLRRGNVYARCRMIVLYDVSAETQALVLGTSNKTELLLGYGTLFGDLASAVNPIGDLYKSHVRQLAEHLGVPEVIRVKPPTADLWPGQRDEDELGASYDALDAALVRLIDDREDPARLVEDGLDPAFVRSVVERVRRNQYKRRMPIIAKLSKRTIGPDFRLPRDAGLSRDRRLAG